MGQVTLGPSPLQLDSYDVLLTVRLCAGLLRPAAVCSFSSGIAV